MQPLVVGCITSNSIWIQSSCHYTVAINFNPFSIWLSGEKKNLVLSELAVASRKSKWGSIRNFSPFFKESLGPYFRTHGWVRTVWKEYSYRAFADCRHCRCRAAAMAHSLVRNSLNHILSAWDVCWCPIVVKQIVFLIPRLPAKSAQLNSIYIYQRIVWCAESGGDAELHCWYNKAYTH